MIRLSLVALAACSMAAFASGCGDDIDCGEGLVEVDGVCTLADAGPGDGCAAAEWFVDQDGDGYGAGTAMVGCEAPEGTIDVGGDCDDSDAAIAPGVDEVCDEVDQDCDEMVDEGTGAVGYPDADGDGYGDATMATVLCDGAREGFVDNGDDCDDSSADASPEGTEVCDELDNDCNGMVDEGVATTFYLDADEDGYGDPTMSVEACALPEGHADNRHDCDDSRGMVNPDGTEICNEIDDDCDGMVDDGVLTRYWRDCDGDGFAVLGATMELACSEPAPAAGCSGGWTDLMPTNTLNDCADEVAEASPNQEMYFDEPIPGTSDDYDWNCNGTTEQLWTGTNGECGTSLLDCATNAGWSGTTVPACGDSAELVTCRFGGSPIFTCRTTRSNTQQTCR